MNPSKRANSSGHDPHVTAGDGELIRRLRNGDEAALATMMEKYSAKVFSAAFRVLRQRAEAQEVTQDVFLAVWRFPERFDNARGPLITWLIIVSRSRALDLLRRLLANAPRQNELTSEILNSNPALVESFRTDRKILVEELLDRLSKEQCSVVRKAHLEGYALAEIAAKEDIPLGTVKNRARFALKKMRAELGPQ